MFLRILSHGSARLKDPFGAVERVYATAAGGLPESGGTWAVSVESQIEGRFAAGHGREFYGVAKRRRHRKRSFYGGRAFSRDRSVEFASHCDDVTDYPADIHLVGADAEAQIGFEQDCSGI